MTYLSRLLVASLSVGLVHPVKRRCLFPDITNAWCGAKNAMKQNFTSDRMK